MQKADEPIVIEDLDAATAGAQRNPHSGHVPDVKLHKPIRAHSILDRGVRSFGDAAGYDREAEER